MKKQNKWEQLFEEFMDLTEFSLIKHKDGWGLYDRQGANLGDIQSDRFANAEQIFERMTIYINDYIYRDLEDEIDAYEVDLGDREFPWGAETWLDLRNEQELYEKYKDFFDDHKFDFDLLNMLCNHYDEIDLNNVDHEEEEE